MKKIISIVGARPQFIKHAPVQVELEKCFNAITINTGQHYDSNMSKVFFDELNIRKPEYVFSLPKGIKGQGEQTAHMMIEIEKVFLEEQPNIVLVYGDTNSTLAGVLVARKMNIPIVHIEAGLRSFNNEMPEEINRIIADRFSDILFCPTEQSIKNLKAENINDCHIFLTGDVMKDCLFMVKEMLKKPTEEDFYFSTLHRPYNTDSIERLEYILNELNNLDKKVFLAIHPRTKNILNSNGIEFSKYSRIEFLEPLGYIESLSYQKYADAVLTDSGGIQKEAYILKTKCITIRTETEWVETLEGGWNTLMFNNLDNLKTELLKVPNKDLYNEEHFGNGKSAADIVNKILTNV